MEVQGGTFEYYEVTGTDDQSQFKGFLVVMSKLVAKFSFMDLVDIRKRWIDFYN